MRGIFRARWLGIAVMAMPWPALATLGGTVDSIQADAAAMLRHRNGDTQTRALPRISNVTPADAIGLYKVSAYRTAFGSEVREYMFGDVVFGVAWSGPDIPDLAKLLGDSYEAYTRKVAEMRNDALLDPQLGEDRDERPGRRFCWAFSQLPGFRFLSAKTPGRRFATGHSITRNWLCTNLFAAPSLLWCWQSYSELQLKVRL